MLTDKESNYDISCTWATSIPDATVTFHLDNDPKEWDDDGGIIHVITDEKLVYLKKVDGEPCIFHIKLNDPFTQITNVSIVSEGRILEIYGKYGEYIKTCKCELLFEDNGLSYYGTQTDLLTTEEMTIKFPGVKEGIWLCGIKVLFKNVPPSFTSSFDYNLIDDKLKKCNVPITEKAEQFKKFLQEYAAKKYPSTKSLDPQMLLKMMEGECMSHFKPVETAGKNISKYLSNLVPSSVKETTNCYDEENIHNDIKKDSETGELHNLDKEGTASSLKCYVDEKMHKLEERLQDNIKIQLQELEAKQNEKLDSILALLKNSVLS